MKKKSLGKGLSALINTDNLEELKAENLKSKITDLEIKKIRSNLKQPRKVFDKVKLKELSDSIRNFGLIEPIIVRRKGKEYELIAGERRLKAAGLAGYKTIPSLIKQDKKTEDNVLEIMLIENLQREDLTPIEEAAAYQEILTSKNLTHDKLSALIGKTRTYITNMLRILRLPAPIQAHINENRLNAGHAKVLAGLDKKEQARFAAMVLKENLTVRQLEQLARKPGGENVPRGTGSNVSRETFSSNSKKGLFLKDCEQKLRNNLKTKVAIRADKKENGRIEINFYSFKDLNTILSKLLAK